MFFAIPPQSCQTIYCFSSSLGTTRRMDSRNGEKRSSLSSWALKNIFSSIPKIHRVTVRDTTMWTYTISPTPIMFDGSWDRPIHANEIRLHLPVNILLATIQLHCRGSSVIISRCHCCHSRDHDSYRSRLGPEIGWVVYSRTHSGSSSLARMAGRHSATAC